MNTIIVFLFSMLSVVYSRTPKFSDIIIYTFKTNDCTGPKRVYGFNFHDCLHNTNSIREETCNRTTLTYTRHNNNNDCNSTKPELNYYSTNNCHAVKSTHTGEHSYEGVIFHCNNYKRTLNINMMPLTTGSGVRG